MAARRAGWLAGALAYVRMGRLDDACGVLPGLDPLDPPEAAKLRALVP